MERCTKPVLTALCGSSFGLRNCSASRGRLTLIGLMFDDSMRTGAATRGCQSGGARGSGRPAAEAGRRSDRSTPTAHQPQTTAHGYSCDSAPRIPPDQGCSSAAPLAAGQCYSTRCSMQRARGSSAATRSIPASLPGYPLRRGRPAAPAAGASLPSFRQHTLPASGARRKERGDASYNVPLLIHTSLGDSLVRQKQALGSARAGYRWQKPL
jgi:hypothetical protein